MGESYEKLHEDATFRDTGVKVNTAPSGNVPTSADYATDKDVAGFVDATIKYLTSREPPLSFLLGNQVAILGSPLGNHLPIKFGKP